MDWFNGTTVPNIKTAFDTWGDEDLRPISKAKKLDWFNAFRNSAGITSPPTTQQLEHALFEGVIETTPAPQPITVQPTPPEDPPHPKEPRSPKPKQTPLGPGGTPTSLPPQGTPTTLAPGGTPTPLAPGGIPTPPKPGQTILDHPVPLTFAPGAPQREHVAESPPAYVDSGNKSTYESMFDDKVAPNIQSLKLMFVVTQVIDEDTFPNSPATNLVGKPTSPIRGYSDNHCYELSRGGKYYPYRGRGPVWDDNSCALDCVIVAARLLDLGALAVDMPNQTYLDWFNGLSPLSRNLIGALRDRWDSMTTATNKQKRLEYLNSIYDEINRQSQSRLTYKLGDFVSASLIWTIFAGIGRQTTFQTLELAHCKSCSRSSPKRIVTRNTLDVKIPAGYKPHMNITLEDILQRRLGGLPDSELQDHDCGGKACFEQSRTAVHGSLPPRLVLEPTDVWSASVRGVTDYLDFTYMTDDLTEHEVGYRWLGGIYLRSNHFRVYWADTRYPDRRGHVMIYDGKLCSGAIVGGIPPHHPEHKVPDWWAKSPTILFYERVGRNRTRRVESVAPPSDDLFNPNKPPSTTTGPTKTTKVVKKQTTKTSEPILIDQDASQPQKIVKRTTETVIIESEESGVDTPKPKNGSKKRPLEAESPAEAAKRVKAANEAKKQKKETTPETKKKTPSKTPPPKTPSKKSPPKKPPLKKSSPKKASPKK